MLVIFGRYRFAAKIVAFRNDWCARCNREVVAVAERTIDFGHFFWIPILPLGIWTRWFCKDCGMDPAQSAETSRAVRVLTLLLVLGVLLPAGYFAWKNDPTVQGGFTLFVLAIVVIGGGYTAWWAFMPFYEKTFDERRAAVKPFEGAQCPACNGAMSNTFVDASCSGCGAEHRPLKKSMEVLGSS